MNDFYKDLLSGHTTLQDVSDAELGILRAGWWDGDVFHPNEFVWDNARVEQNRRKIEAVTKHVAEQKAKRKDKFKSDFFG
jgi:hypothetical protein